MSQINWVHRTMIVPDNLVENVRSLAESFGPASSGMWTTALSSTGKSPATHWISAGLIDENMAQIMESPEALKIASENTGVTITLEEAAFILSNCDITEEEPLTVIERLQLKMVNDETS